MTFAVKLRKCQEKPTKTAELYLGLIIGALMMAGVYWLLFNMSLNVIG